MIINLATELLKKGETAIVLFTRGLHLELADSADGSGWSGYWRTKPDRHHPIDKVVIYNRPHGHVSLEADVYLADYVDAENSAEAQWRGRVIVRFHDAKHIGTTNRTWYQFAETGPLPVRYLSK